MVTFLFSLSGCLWMNLGGTEMGSMMVQANSRFEHESYSTEKKKMSLHREWEFYWNQLLDPKAIKQEDIKPDYIQVPSSWQENMINGETLPNFGYATYRLQLKVPPEDIGRNKALYLEYVGTAYQLWIDGQKKQGIGVVGKSRDEETPKLRLNLAFFEPKYETVEIVIQVSNHSFREGGIFGEVSYGDPTALIPSIVKTFAKEISIIGGFFFVGLYHIVIFGIRKIDLPSLLIGLIGMAGAIRTLLLNEYLMFLLIPGISWELMTKVEYLVEIAGFTFVVLLMKHMYPKEVHTISLRLAYVFVAACSAYVLLTPVHVFTETMFIHVTMMSIFLFYFVFYVGIVAAWRKREGAQVNLIALAIIVVSMCHDTLYYTQVIDTFSTLEYSVLLFLLLQAVIVSYRYSQLFGKNEMLTAELVKMNHTLEEKVIERTKELQEKNEELFRLATTDGLTGMLNRRYFLDRVKEQLAEGKSGISLLLIDIDNFKRINDRYGHMGGDQVLITFSDILKTSCASEGIVGRIGGEEFAVCLAGIEKEESMETAERLRAFTENGRFFLDEGEQIPVTVSIGTVYTKRKDIIFEELYHHADMALYTSKETGKNKVTFKELTI
ncbi:sensor domain-containing diguanylate cyclase [Priestia abyssalis]|uniref:sensor domain-containing diguanylate cyclase n=1 Tax=Priestia abyssalis TaxID=1221450 RepID=UPI0014727356|nr:diguanylate cyclase [Priestia abyssalis]